LATPWHFDAVAVHTIKGGRFEECPSQATGYGTGFSGASNSGKSPDLQNNARVLANIESPSPRLARPIRRRFFYGAFLRCRAGSERRNVLAARETVGHPGPAAPPPACM
jgi:hypothetical protein